MEEELWKVIEKLPKYEVSTFGHIRRIDDGKIMKLYSQKSKSYPWKKYIRFVTGKPSKNYRVHRLVGIAFIPNPNNLPTINHKDNDQTNNYVNNLEWMTVADNLALRKGTKYNKNLNKP